MNTYGKPRNFQHNEIDHLSIHIALKKKKKKPQTVLISKKGSHATFLSHLALVINSFMMYNVTKRKCRVTHKRFWLRLMFEASCS